ncbi:hypothetical protein SAMD00019534_039530 [Acytostelium subglobosum LB1]|uniref:hypothetical protein n=1 Tax=Acytostelium subglobosum LB1 TaxID=1410327 RepID=UPI000644B770|nr:hypothetical protein SAMD00019534_039530 [Acytostelium subglobosum LB1]GAM20778.1 hypothetical protein SAMD00019534_039530 [Acytostelium subglobosum LB1]|eukprot:XP_012755912.1 hypothetical protein SAMD00019534_039530 [Acytostelium subglobosum LB1]
MHAAGLGKQSLLIPKQPLLLLHGLFGFRELGPFVYFHGITEPLKSLGAKVVATRVHPTDSIANRAAQLQTQLSQVLKQYNTDKVHVIAHSMGGLDARYLINKLDWERNIMSLTTLATPHRGSYIADWSVLNIKQKLKIESLFKVLDIPLLAIDQLTPQYINECFNPEITDVPDVQYKSYGAWKQFESKFSYLYYFGQLLAEREGRNDGLVSMDSARWGQSFNEIPNCDHINIINWSESKFDIMPTYQKILSDLYHLEQQRELKWSIR